MQWECLSDLDSSRIVCSYFCTRNITGCLENVQQVQRVVYLLQKPVFFACLPTSLGTVHSLQQTLEHIGVLENMTIAWEVTDRWLSMSWQKYCRIMVLLDSPLFWNRRPRGLFVLVDLVSAMKKIRLKAPNGFGHGGVYEFHQVEILHSSLFFPKITSNSFSTLPSASIPPCKIPMLPVGRIYGFSFERLKTLCARTIYGGSSFSKWPVSSLPKYGMDPNTSDAT